MTASESWLLLVETTVATSLAVLLVLGLRRPVRHAFGAGVAYGLWAAVPLMLIAVLLPAAIEPTLAARSVATSILDAVVPAEASLLAGDGSLTWLPWAWGGGVLAMLLGLMWQQHRFLIGLGPLRRRPDGCQQSLATRGLPAVVGWWPRIVLPGDFEQRYSAAERTLVLAHEREHLRRADLPAGLLALLLRCLFWFNPLMHMAARRFRHDQELACDTGVLRRFPEHRRTYASAMLKTQLADQPLPFGCHWSGAQPIKERLAMLSHPLPSRRRRLGGLCAVSLLVVATATAGWASQPGRPTAAPPGKMLLELAIKVDGEPVRDLRAVVAPGITHEERFDHAGRSWHTRWTVEPLADGTFDLRSSLEQDGNVLAEPRVVLRDDATLHIGRATDDGGFNGLSIDLRISAGPPPPGTAAVDR